MATRKEFLAQIWENVVNGPMPGHWIDNVIAAAEHNPESPFADLGPALQRLIALGADRRDLSLISRFASYEAAFEILYMLDDPGVDDDNNKMMHEELLGADPSGLEGRPGSVT